ncbi:MAG: methionyl-tRNA formyltransferase [Gammaproteobacteria bacterium]|nr:methionyl-tRNA formyltransferase [Gammaproteobacteria bacterium]
MHKLRLCFAGTPAFAAEHLARLIEANHQIIAVYTQPDRPAGRGKQVQPSPVKQVAEKAGLRVLQPETLRNQTVQQDMQELDADLMVVVAYGLILPQAILDIPKFGCINVHASLLPRWRGAAPIERAILARDKETGVTIMQMEVGLDTGPILHRVKIAIDAEDNRRTLTEKLSNVGQEALLYTLDNLALLRSEAKPQNDSDATYARKVGKAEALIDWSKDAADISAVIRVGIGRNPAYSFLGTTRLRLISGTTVSSSSEEPPGTVFAIEKDNFFVACGNASLKVNSIQLPGKNPITVRDLLNSNQTLIKPGIRFGDCTDLQP